MPLDWSPWIELVRRHHRFLVTTHTRPDGDALGSQLALAEALESLGKQVYRVIPSRMPPKYEFMDPRQQIESYQSPAGAHLQSCDAVVIVDTGTWNQLAELAEFVKYSHAETFVIDHHQTQDDLRGGRIVDTTSESCGRLAHDAIRALNVVVTPTMAHNLFIAVATDTGWFRYSNTSAATLQLCGELMAQGAQPTSAYERIYDTNSHGRVLLIGKVCQRVQTRSAGRLAWSEVWSTDYEETGAIPPDTEDLINFPRSIAGVEIAIMFIEQREGGVKVSFRSQSDVDVARLAEKFHGGGHKRAAGATVPGTMADVRNRVLLEAERCLS